MILTNCWNCGFDINPPRETRNKYYCPGCQMDFIVKKFTIEEKIVKLRIEVTYQYEKSLTPFDRFKSGAGGVD